MFMCRIAQSTLPIDRNRLDLTVNKGDRHRFATLVDGLLALDALYWKGCQTPQTRETNASNALDPGCEKG